MSAAALLARAAREGVTITPAGEALALTGPPAAVQALAPAVREAKAQVLALLAPPPGIRHAQTDRRTCTECSELHGTRCTAAARGELAHAARQYEPMLDRLHRCIAYRPGPDDTDRRTGRERWPGMARKAGHRHEKV